MARMTQSEKNSAYRKERKKLLQNVRRMEKRGYDISGIDIPSIPHGKIKKSDIEAIKKANINRYKNASLTTEVTYKHGLQTVTETRTFKGERARTIERRRATVKGQAERNKQRGIPKEAREHYRWLRDNKDRYGDMIVDADAFLSEVRSRSSYGEVYGSDYELDEDGQDYWYRVGDEWFHGETQEYVDAYYDFQQKGTKPSEDAVWDENNGVWRTPSLEIDEQKNVYYMDIETGEVIELPYGAKKPFAMGEYIRIMPTKERGEKMYETIMHDLDIMEQYQGNPQHGKNTKHDAITRENATKIKEGLEKLYNENRNALYDALDAYGDDIISVDYMYRAGGYQNYLLKLASAFQYRGYGFDLDEDEGDYDEGNFEY